MGDDISPGGGIPPDKAEETSTELNETVGHRRRRQPSTPTVSSVDAITTEQESDKSLDPSRIDSGNNLPTCTAAGCTRDVDSQMIKCTKCERNTHFSCTRLPGYQLAMFMTKGYRKFVCAACHGDVHADYTDYDNSKTTSEKNKSWAAWATLREQHILSESEVGRLNSVVGLLVDEKEKLKNDNEKLNQQLLLKQDELDRVNDCLSTQKKENVQIKQKQRKDKSEYDGLKEEGNVLENRLRTQGLLIQDLKRKLNASVDPNTTNIVGNISPQRFSKLQGEYKALEEKLTDTQTLLDKKTKQSSLLKGDNNNLRQKVEILNSHQEVLRKTVADRQSSKAGVPNIPTGNKKDPTKLDTIHEDVSGNNIDAKLEAFSANIVSKVTRIMDEKLKVLKTPSPIPNRPSSEPLEHPDSPHTWSSIVNNQPHNLRSMMRDARNDEKIEESEKQRRAKNIIIHGADEVGETPEGIKKEDIEYIKQIFTKIGIASTPTLITRLGEPNESRSRPIKLVMKSADEKDNVMKNLGRLKGTERYFGKISVKDDYTTSEREEIRLLTERAKKETAENPDKFFKVRGNSKNGWRVVSFSKK